MRILLLTQHFPPETSAPANRISVIASRLAEVHDLTVVTLRPSYPTQSAFAEHAAGEVDAVAPYRVKRTFHFHPHTRSPLLRATGEHAMAVGLATLASRVPADLVVTSSPSMFLGPATWALARAKRAAFVWDVRDLTWQYTWIATSRGLKVAARAQQEYMWRTARAANLLVAATEGIQHALIDHGSSANKTILVPNAASNAFVRATEGLQVPPHTVRPLVSYVGLVGHAQALQTMIHVAEGLPSVDFLIAGDGPDRQKLERASQRAGLTNLAFTGYLSTEGVLDVYRRSNLLFAQLRDHPGLASTAMPSKLFEYMATGRPFVYAGSGLAVTQLEVIGCAKTVPSEQPHLIQAAIRELLNKPSEMLLLGQRGRRFAETTADRAAAVQPLLDALTLMSGARGRA